MEPSQRRHLLELIEGDAGHPSAAASQRVEVAQRLGVEEGAEGERLARDGDVDFPAVVHNLEEGVGGWTALVELAGGVEVAGPKPTVVATRWRSRTARRTRWRAASVSAVGSR
jgi:hypothetical protein